MASPSTTPRIRKPLKPMSDEPTVGEKLAATEVVLAEASGDGAKVVAPKKAETIRFNVRRLGTGAINITSSLTLDKYPTPMMTASALSAKHRKSVMEFVRRNAPYMDLNSLIRAFWPTITAEEWAEALCTAAIKQSAMSTEAECIVSAPVKNVFMALDDTLYKLSPVGMVGTNRALATVRKRALSEAKSAGDAALAKATAEAELLVKNAQTNANAIFMKSQQVQAEITALKASMNHLPPHWAIENGYPVQWIAGEWRLILSAKLNITEFIWEQNNLSAKPIRKRWAASKLTPQVDRTMHFYYTVGIDTQFSISNMKTLGSVYLPHITPEKTCMQPADAPSSMKKPNDAAQLVNAVNRCLSKVDLHSMLVHPPSWDARMWWFVPDDLKKLLQDPNYNWATALERFCNAADDVGRTDKALVTEREIEVVHRDEERKETWTA